MKGVYDIFGLEVGEVKKVGGAVLTAYEFKDDPLYNMRAIRDGGHLFTMLPGKYVRLAVNKQLMMSDTRMERLSNQEFIQRANGHVLIAGLGIGLIIENIKDKLATGMVQSITVIEKYKDVIKLVKPYFKHEKIKIVEADIMDWQPPTGMKYDTIYFDIWPTICEDNLPEISKLHNRFKFKVNRSNPKWFMNSWMKEYIQKMKRAS